MGPLRTLVFFAVLLAGCGAVDTPLNSDAGLDELDQERATVEILACDAAGTGVIVSKRHVLTAFHVIAGCGPVIVRLHDGSLRIATLEVAHVADLARLRVLDDDLPDYRPPVASAGMGDVVCLTAAHPARVRECGVVRIFKSDRREAGDARFGAKVVKGNSGGPVWRGTMLVGIVVQCDLHQPKDGDAVCVADVGGKGGGFTALDGRKWIATDVDLR